MTHWTRICRPELLVREAFDAIPIAMAKLQELFPGADISKVVERQPYLLVANCDEVIDEMLR